MQEPALDVGSKQRYLMLVVVRVLGRSCRTAACSAVPRLPRSRDRERVVRYRRQPDKKSVPCERPVRVMNQAFLLQPLRCQACTHWCRWVPHVGRYIITPDVGDNDADESRRNTRKRAGLPPWPRDRRRLLLQTAKTFTCPALP